MGFIDIRKYIDCPAAVFDLQGRVYRDEEGVPCRIKVGPRRFLNTRVCPEELKVVLWSRKDGAVTYLHGLEVPVERKEDGSLELDATALVKKHFGKRFSYCDKDQWRWNKKRVWSDTFLATDLGVAATRTVWLDIDWTHSNLFFAPGVLKLCGHEVSSIYWATFSGTCGAAERDVRPLVEKLLSAPHALEGEDVKKRLEEIPELWFNRLSIRTDRGNYSVDTSMGEELSVELADGTGIGGYRVRRACSCLDQVEILLRLMKADGEAQIKAALETLREQGLVTRTKR